MGMFMGSVCEDSASWWLRSKKDPRWDANGRCAASLAAIDEACRKAIALRWDVYGETPTDLEYGGMKD